MSASANPKYDAITSVSNLLAFTACRPPTVAIIQSLDKAIRELERTHPKGIGYVHGIFPDGTRQGLDPEIREAFLSLVRKNHQAIGAAIVIVAVDGFTGATLRAVVTGVALAAGVKVPVKVVSNVDEATDWFLRTMQRHGAHVPTAADVRKVVELGRAELGV